MCKLKIALLLVFASGQICGSQIFGGGGGLNRPQGLPRGGILNPDGAQFGGGIIGGAGIGTLITLTLFKLFTIKHRT